MLSVGGPAPRRAAARFVLALAATAAVVISLADMPAAREAEEIATLATSNGTFTVRSARCPIYAGRDCMREFDFCWFGERRAPARMQLTP